jgi:hypothetical protein
MTNKKESAFCWFDVINDIEVTTFRKKYMN